MSASSSALALAAWLRALDHDALVTLLRARPVREAGVRDVFDLAESLLDEANVHACLEHLDRRDLAVLAAAGSLAEVRSDIDAGALAGRLGRARSEVEEELDALERLALLARDGERVTIWDQVRSTLGGWPARGLPSGDELIDTAPPTALVPLPSADHATADRGAGERAFATVAAVGELISTFEREPGRLLQRGGVALPDWRRMLAATSAPDDATLDAYLALADTAGLVDRAPDGWRPTADGIAWREQPRVGRWTALAVGWFERVPIEIRAHLRERAHVAWGAALDEYLGWLYPAGAAWLEGRARDAIRSAHVLGILADDDIPSRAGAALLADGPDAAGAAITDLFPADVRQVYIQHDLSVIAPGPLAADVDRRLREVADVENVGIASTYRFTAASLTRALTTGLGAEEVRALLGEISLTGVPQPLEYLLADTASRFGSLRVGALDGSPGPDAGAHAYVRADDPSLIGQLAVDQTLGALVLRRTGEHRAVTRFDAETLYWSLVDARYPAVYEDADGGIRAVKRAPAVTRETVDGPDAAERLAERIRTATAEQPVESGAAWNARQLELAIKSRIAVTVTVRMPDGSETAFLLEPAGLAGGRLRARDRRADIERTLPLSHIVAVAPAD